MLWVDTHAHLYSVEFEVDRKEMIQRALEAGVQKLLLPNIDTDSIQPLLQLTKDYPSNCYAMMGIHPCYVTSAYVQQLKHTETLLSELPIVAIGEIGLDYYWSQELIKEQQIAFEQQLHWAAERQLPVSIHSREATAACIETVQKIQDGRLSGVFHCFSGTLEEAHQIIDLGFSLGIGGVLTFKKSGLDLLLSEIPIEKMVLETDAPYLAPSPFRGKRNESAYIPLIGQKLADIKNLKIEEVAAITSSNAHKIFKML
jgi:TatD DNase family protein